ncbi:MAG: hypothetical protein HY901_36635 [Deltaproteobacteria bacterium]|nr:hypothetical protein [Deltaproteobacteria bacterium]
MSEIDDRKALLASLYETMKPLRLTEDLSEADVRAKIVDPLFVQALGWPEPLIRRERHTSSKEFIDYVFGAPVALFLLEAKRASRLFTIPGPTLTTNHVIKELMRTDKALQDAIEQVARYCQDEGYPFAVVSNGIQLCIFRAVRTDKPWKNGQAVVFRSPEEILERFAHLWSLLSYPAVIAGSLTKHFAFPDNTPRQFKSAISTLPNADETLIRNSLSGDLIPVLRGVFEDLTDDRHLEVLERCYVYSDPLAATANDFVLNLRDLPPAFLKNDVKDVEIGRFSGGAFTDALATLARDSRRGTVFLLLGGVGSGKTTFLRQVRVRYCANVIENEGSYFYLDFRDSPPRPPFDDFVFKSLRKQLDSQVFLRHLCRKLTKTDLVGERQPLSSPVVLRALFERELEEVDCLARELGVTSNQTIAKRKLNRLLELEHDDREVVRRALYAIQAAGRFVLLVFDNADQLTPEAQLEVFLFAQNIAADTGGSIVVALREEKYYLASQRGAFNAFQTHKFHVPSPKLTDLLSLRLGYAIENLDKLLFDPGRKEDVALLLHAIMTGGVGEVGRRGSSNVVRLLERLCMGNMRLALKMFRSFLQSGNTNVDKIVRICREAPSVTKIPYHVPFHEFTKSVMLGDHRYYRESNSDVLNLFGISGLEPNSHFTALRLLALLMTMSERASTYGRGFVEVREVLEIFASVFGDSSDGYSQLRRLLRAGLVESDTTVADSLDHLSAVRAAPAGEYYLTYLAKAFAYLDLVWIDTPICDAPTLARLQSLLHAQDKDGRYERVDRFLGYLSAQEQRERKSYPAIEGVGAWASPLMPSILEQIAKEKREIDRRFAKNNS